MSARVWSALQEAIFSWFASGTGNLVVRARAGTSKTTSMVEGINRAPEPSILACAFNKDIATELTAKLKNPRAEAKTTHGVCFGFVRRNWENVRVDETRGVRIAREVCGPTAPDAMITLVAKLASKAKGMAPFPKPGDISEIAYQFDLVPEEEWEEEGWTLDRIEGLVCRALDRAATKDGSVDFDDMIFCAVRNGWIRPRWDLVVVDEAQDMNVAQIIVAQKACKKGGRIVVVGDDRQAIYGFRGADSGSIDRLKKELNAVEMPLTITYRCPKAVVALAKEIVPDYEAHPSAPDGEVLEMGKDAMLSAAAAGDFILSRKNAPLASVCLALLRSGKRAKVRGKDIGRGLVSLVKRLSKGKAGKSMVDFLTKLETWTEKETARAETLKNEASRQTRKDFVADQAETIRTLADGLAGVAELAARIEDLFSDNGTADHVICSSVHKAKGLESERVFILKDTFREGGNIEEANVKYVAITRAKKTLVWVPGIS